MSTHGGLATLKRCHGDSDRQRKDLQVEFIHARAEAGAAARGLRAACARGDENLLTLNVSLQRMRRAAGRLHEAIGALLITSPAANR